jgi:hypothetical protein
MVGVTFLQKVYRCLLADPYMVSEWVKTLGAVVSVKVTLRGLVIIVCVSRWSEGAGVRQRWDLFCAKEKSAVAKSDYWGNGKCENGSTEGEDYRCL